MKRIHRLFLSLFSGVLLSLAWLGFPGWILFIAWLPLLVVDKYFVDRKAEFRSVSFWGHAFFTVFIWNLLSTWWIVHATAVGAVMAIVTNSFLMSLVWWLAHIARRKFASNLGYIALIVFWISFEYFHFHWDIEWPWLQLGNGFANNVKMIQWYEFTGAFGGTLWVLSLNVLLFRFLVQAIDKKQHRQAKVSLSAFLLVLLVPLGFSIFRYFTYTESGEPRQVTVVQPNVDPYSESYDMHAERRKKERFLHLADSVSNPNTDFIVGPETVFENPRLWNEKNLKTNDFVRDMKAAMQRYNKAEIVFGVSSYVFYTNPEDITPTARLSRNGSYYDRFNTAIFLDRNDEEQIYHKSKLVVGVEKMPFTRLLRFVNDIVINIGGTTGSLGRQEDASVFTSADGTKVAPVICYESVFGEYVTHYVQKGAQLVFIITNDGWWKNTPGYRQHMSFARLRAIENRRSIARAANTGISCFINQRGDVIQQSDWWVDTALAGTINTNDKLTFYAQFGDYIARVSLFVSVLFALLLITKRRK